MSDLEKKGLVPELRFPEFKDICNWKESELGKVARSATGESNREDSTSEGKYAFFDRSDEIRASSKYLFDTEAIIVAGEGQEFIPKYFVGKFDLHQRAYATLDFEVDVIGKYVFYWMHQNRRHFNTVAVGSTVPSLRLPMFADFPIKLPDSVDEQQKIADCLTSIDDLIDAHIQKLEALKAHKKGLIQQLFPAEGETVPKLRFPEFLAKGEWRSKKIEALAKRGSGHTPNKKHSEYYNGGINWVSLADSKKLDNGLIFNTSIEISQEGLDNSSAVLHPAGSVIISRDAGVGKSAVLNSPMAVSQHFITWQCKKGELSNWYLYYLLQLMKPAFESIAVGNTIKTIGLPYFKTLEIPAPSFDEQEKVANCLSSVDGLITSQAKKIEALKTHKKGLMQQLFPSISEVDV